MSAAVVALYSLHERCGSIQECCRGVIYYMNAKIISKFKRLMVSKLSKALVKKLKLNQRNVHLVNDFVRQDSKLSALLLD
jgi:hypothetical protein